jgi:ribosome biogenesis GTPase
MPHEAVVKKSTGSWYELLTPGGEILKARIKGKIRLEGRTTTNPAAVGDHVFYTTDKNTGDHVIEELKPRTNYLIRKSNNLSRQEQIIAANLDQVLIVATLALPRTSQGFIDRILATAEAYEITPVIVFNKMDLFGEEELEILNEAFKMYSDIGYECFPISVKTGQGIDQLKKLLEGKVTLITGHSGVGKSSLLNTLVPGLEQKTSTISGSSLKGKHTTTFAEMFLMDEKTFIIDTPGIKDFGLVEIQKEELSHYFPEMRRYLGECRFKNCLHIDEPGCAVLEALEKGEIHPARYASYISMLQGEESHK